MKVRDYESRFEETLRVTISIERALPYRIAHVFVKGFPRAFESVPLKRGADLKAIKSKYGVNKVTYQS